jgi:hypothetical protein
MHMHYRFPAAIGPYRHRVACDRSAFPRDGYAEAIALITHPGALVIALQRF